MNLAEKVSLLFSLLGILGLFMYNFEINKPSFGSEKLSGKIINVWQNSKLAVITLEYQCKRSIYLYKAENISFTNGTMVKISGSESDGKFYATLVE